MAGKVNDYPRASVAIFSPQSKAPGEIYLKQLHTFLCHSKRLEPLAQSVLGLKDVWNTLAHERQDIADLGQWPQCLQDLSEWIITGQSSRIANCVAGMISLPLLVIIQVCQYLQYLELCGLSHSEFMAQLRHRGGVQGYCGGLLPALAIACSKNEAEVVVNAVTAMRLALAIGTCGELGDDKSVPGATTIVVRTKRVGQGDELIERFPGVSFPERPLAFPLSSQSTLLTGANRHTYPQSQTQKRSASSGRCLSFSSSNLMHENRVCSYKRCTSEVKSTTPRTPDSHKNYVKYATRSKFFSFLTLAACKLL